MENTHLISYKDGIMGVIKIRENFNVNGVNFEDILIEMEEEFFQWEYHDGVKVIVFTSEYEGFIPSFQINSYKIIKTLSRLCERIENSSKITIFIMNGYVIEMDFEIAIASDIRIAAEKTKISFSERNLAYFPVCGGVKRLVKLIGSGRALYLILTGDWLDSMTAKKIGLISRIVPYEELWTTVLELVSNVMNKKMLKIRMAKLVINEEYETSLKNARMKSFQD